MSPINKMQQIMNHKVTKDTKVKSIINKYNENKMLI